jgi:hypothetical protein
LAYGLLHFITWKKFVAAANVEIKPLGGDRRDTVRQTADGKVLEIRLKEQKLVILPSL